MKILVIVLIILKLLHNLYCGQPTHVDHMCGDNVAIEQAGMGSGTQTFDGSLCELTITEIPELQKKNSEIIDQVSRLNIVGVRRNDSCDVYHIVIDSKTYCVDESVKDTVIKVTDQQMKFSIVSYQAKSFILRYYRGKQLSS